jgi:2'-5' RNA ligase
MAHLLEDEKLYFIALVPPEPLKTNLWELKLAMREMYGSKASLNSPAHITLHMPFRLKEKREEELCQGLEQLGNSQKAFPVKLKDYGAFPPRVLFVQVEPSPPMKALYEAVRSCLKRQFYTFNADYKARGFHPHITLAFRDLKKASFQEAWKRFKDQEFQAEWRAENFTLLKHNGHRWDEYRQFALQA